MVTGEMVEELILSGADIIKVGIGPGERVFLLSAKVLKCFDHERQVLVAATAQVKTKMD